jgi:hypothetical protein
MLIAEFFDLWDATENVSLLDQPDKIVWRWTPDGQFTAKSAYNKLHTGAITFRGHALIWKTWAPLRVKIFLWLAFKRKHWTNDRRARHGLQAHEECFLCDQAPESIDHMLSCCPFTRELWFHICTALGKHLPQPNHSVLSAWRQLRREWHGCQRKGFDSLFALVSWQVWKERNARCFRSATTSVTDLLLVIRAEADQWIRAGAKNLGVLVSGE